LFSPSASDLHPRSFFKNLRAGTFLIPYQSSSCDGHLVRLLFTHHGPDNSGCLVRLSYHGFIATTPLFNFGKPG
jgi:hypothetical protein